MGRFPKAGSFIVHIHCGVTEPVLLQHSARSGGWGAVLLNWKLHTLWRHSAGRVAGMLSAEWVGGAVLLSRKLHTLWRHSAGRVAAILSAD